MKVPHRAQRKMLYVLIGLGAGILFTLPTLLLAFLSAGGGHGNYFWANVFFPYSMILLPMLMLYEGPPAPLLVSWLFYLLPCVQFPIYGILIGAFASSFRKAATVAAIIGIAHVVAVAACFITVASHEAERAAAHAAFVEKYDTNCDGKLSPEERQAASREAAQAAREALKKKETPGSR